MILSSKIRPLVFVFMTVAGGFLFEKKIYKSIHRNILPVYPNQFSLRGIFLFLNNYIYTFKSIKYIIQQ